MKIQSEHIAEQGIVGKNARNGLPVFYIRTHGGLSAFFANVDGQVICVGAAPHKAIAAFLAEKQYPGIIEWDRKKL